MSGINNCCCGGGRICPIHGDSTPGEMASELAAPDGSADSLLRAKISELESEVARLRRQARLGAGREPRKGFGGTIQRLREAKGMSLSDLARASGCGKPLVSRIEREDAPKVELRNLIKLAGGLGLRPSEVLAAYESENPQNAEVSDRRAHGNKNTTGANGGSLH